MSGSVVDWVMGGNFVKLNVNLTLQAVVQSLAPSEGPVPQAGKS